MTRAARTADSGRVDEARLPRLFVLVPIEQTRLLFGTSGMSSSDKNSPLYFLFFLQSQHIPS